MSQRDHFFQWIQANPSIIDYIEITSAFNNARKNDSEDYRAESHAKTLEEIKELSKNQYHIIENMKNSKVPSPPPRFHDLSKMYHTTRFLEAELFQTIYAKKEQMFIVLNDLLKLFTTPDLIPNDFLVQCDLERLIHDNGQNCFEIVALKTKYNQFLKSYIKRINIIPDFDLRQRRIFKIFELIDRNFNPKICFFPLSEYQINFEHFTFNPEAPWLEKLDDLIENFFDFVPEDALRIIIEIAKSVCSTFSITENKHLSMTIGFLFRLVFDEVYSKNPNLLHNTINDDLLAKVRNLTIGELDPPKDFCPKWKDSDLVVDVFRNDPKFKDAIKLVETVQFYSNPLDILHVIYETLCIIERAASYYAKDKSMISMLPFEVMFALLLGTVLGSSNPEIIQLSDFTIRYTPRNGLTSEYQFALAKLTALSLHFKSLAEKHS